MYDTIQSDKKWLIDSDFFIFNTLHTKPLGFKLRRGWVIEGGWAPITKFHRKSIFAIDGRAWYHFDGLGK